MDGESCDEFLANNWKKDLCINCQKHVSEHKSAQKLSATQLQKPATNGVGRSRLPTRTLSSASTAGHTRTLPSGVSPPTSKKVFLDSKLAVNKLTPATKPLNSSTVGNKPATISRPPTAKKPGCLVRPGTLAKPLAKPQTGLPKECSRGGTSIQLPKEEQTNADRKVEDTNLSTNETDSLHYRTPKSTPVQDDPTGYAAQPPAATSYDDDKQNACLYDNAAPRVNPEAHHHSPGLPLEQCSPKYDLVAQRAHTPASGEFTDTAMSFLEDSSKAERIYAEVTEEYLRPSSNHGYANSPFSSSAAEYEELNDFRLESNINSKSLSMPHAYGGAGLEPDAQLGAIPSQGKKMSFLKTLLKKGKKSDSGSVGAGQRLEGLDSMTAASKGRQMAAVDNWVAEQNSNNRLGSAAARVSTASTPGISKRSSLSVSTDKQVDGRGNCRGSVSPNQSAQRPDEKPPPPPSAQSKSVIQTVSAADSDRKPSALLTNNNVSPTDKKVQRLSSTQYKQENSGPSLISNIHKVKMKTDSRPDGLYDTPWEDVDTVISNILSKASNKGNPGKEVQPKTDTPSKSNLKKLTIQHNRQISLPDSRPSDPMKANRSGKISPTSATDSGYESTSTTRTISRGQSCASDQISLRSRASSTKSTPLDSVHLCLEQIGAMNNQTLQKLVKAYLQRKTHQLTDIKDYSWNDISLDSGAAPTHQNNKCVFYTMRLKDMPDQPFTAMLSLKEPVACDSYSPNQLPVSNRFKANIEASLLPEQMLKAVTASESQNSNKSPCVEGDRSSGDTKKISVCVTILPHQAKLQSAMSYMRRQDQEAKSDHHLLMDSLFIVLQVINIIFSLAERHKELESLSAGDLVVSLASDSLSTVYCHMISVRDGVANYNLACEKLKLFMVQLTHASDRLVKLKMFRTVDDLVQNSSDAGDLKTIALILNYLLWGPNNDEISVMSGAENKKQAFDLWLHLSRASLLNQLALHPMDSLKTQMMANFLTNTSGNEIHKITKLLSTY